MKTNKKGFTLAETLVVLGLVGVIAAITVPNIAKQVQKSSMPASVGRSVQFVETGIANIFSVAKRKNTDIDTTNSISALQVKDIIDGSSSPEDYLTKDNTLFSVAQGIIGVGTTSNSYLSKIKDYNGTKALSSQYKDFNSSLAYKYPKLSNTIIPYKIDESKITSYITSQGISDIPPSVVIQRVFIDANGEEGPNRIGQDVFLFGLTNSGRMVPAGTQAYNDNIYSETIPLYTAACKTTITDGRSCAARVVADGWKINY